ncbi:MAG: hypothetical protein AAGB31_11500, partial [Bdellovibrio sp.]
MRQQGLFLLLCAFAFSTQADVKSSMDQMLGSILTLKPFIVSETEYADPKNAPLIQDTLKQMIAVSEKVKHEEQIQKNASQVSAQSLTQQLKETELVFRVGNKSYSYWLLRSTLSNCMACHTQLPAASTRFESLSNDFL